MDNNLLIIHGGGPTAVLNCSLYGSIREAQQSGSVDRILGARYGITGVLEERLIDLDDQAGLLIEGLKTSPGSAIGSSRRKIMAEDHGRILEVLERNGVRFLLYTGGNGTMYGAHLIESAARDAGYPLGVIGVPKTVDNDLPGTDRSPGYASAARYIATGVRELGMDVGTLPTPVSILETMGREVGWLAASAAPARTGPDSAPHLIYLPEKPFRKERFLDELDDVLGRLGWAVVVVSEGLRDADGEPVYVTGTSAQADKVGRMLPGGVASYLADLAARELEVRCRSEKPGLCARSSLLLTSPVDREDAEHVGRRAVRAAAEGESGKMVGLLPRETAEEEPASRLVPLEEVAQGTRDLPERFVSQNESFVTEEFLRYIVPLIGPELPQYVTFLQHP